MKTTTDALRTGVRDAIAIWRRAAHDARADHHMEWALCYDDCADRMEALMARTAHDGQPGSAQMSRVVATPGIERPPH